MPEGIPFIDFCMYFFSSVIIIQILEIFDIYTEKLLILLCMLFKVKQLFKKLGYYS